MENYHKEEIEKIENIVNEDENSETIKVLQNAKQILNDSKENQY